jgi:hypothetical protein
MAGDLWIPTTEDELRSALAGRVLIEGHHVDFKAMIGAGDKSNANLAIDLASFAVDSGVVVVGVDESSDPATSAPIALSGLKERVDQVGRSRVDPPLIVTCSEIPAAGKPGKGYLVISVPASPMAPHMVDGIYRGRGDTTNIRLSDAEVRRIRDQRRQGEFDIRAILQAEVQRDPISGEGRKNGHLFVVAEPVFAEAEMLLPIVHDKWRQWLPTTFRNNPPRLTYEWNPDISSALQVVRTPLGWAMRSWEGDRGAAVQKPEGAALELQVNENGGLRLFSGRATEVFRDDGVVSVFESLVFGFVWRMTDWARTVADQTGFVGNWRFGVALTRIAGARTSAIAPGAFRSNSMPFEDDRYEAWTEATYAELVNDPDHVVENLVGRLNRALSQPPIPLPKHA